MARRQLLTDEQWTRLLAPSSDEREAKDFVKHFELYFVLHRDEVFVQFPLS
jgi:hypothetical protein